MGVRFSGKPVTLSPLLDDYDEWDNKRNLLSCEEVNYRIVLNVDGLLFVEVKVVCDEKRFHIQMKHDNRHLRKDREYAWNRDCTYEYKVPSTISVNKLGAYWTDDQFLITQLRNAESASSENWKGFRLIPISIIDVLRPGIDVDCLTQHLKTLVMKINELSYYVDTATVIPQEKDFLSLLTSTKLTSFEDEMSFSFDEDKEESSSLEGSIEKDSDSKQSGTSEGKSKPAKSSSKPKRGAKE
ncbi:hypothetical protein CDAR_391891 [Caerostris darwini]|uniref:Uncharacterized protein n=1 Tax=Caerostris darwini TaxID=1538125 RepID=A0AAV4S1W9_9ARAC|nr:hypothetical protein CDAR_391891 [Caerostris darwini]